MHAVKTENCMYVTKVQLGTGKHFIVLQQTQYSNVVFAFWLKLKIKWTDWW